MHPYDIHHVKAYIVFFLVSFWLIGWLVYLYIPQSKDPNVVDNIRSETLNIPNDTFDWSSSAEGESIGDIADEQETVVEKRKRYTRLLLMYQKDLKDREEQRNIGNAWLDSENEAEITRLQEAIQNTEFRIRKLSQTQ